MELSRRVVVAAGLAAVAAAAVVAAPSAGAATPAKLTARIGAAVFSTTYLPSRDGGGFSWKLTAPGYHRALLAVRLIVPYNGKPLALTLCMKCRSTEVGQAVVATPIAKVIAAGKARVEIDPPKGKTLFALLR